MGPAIWGQLFGANLKNAEPGSPGCSSHAFTISECLTSYDSAHPGATPDDLLIWILDHLLATVAPIDPDASYDSDQRLPRHPALDLAARLGDGVSAHSAIAFMVHGQGIRRLRTLTDSDSYFRIDIFGFISSDSYLWIHIFGLTSSD